MLVTKKNPVLGCKKSTNKTQTSKISDRPKSEVVLAFFSKLSTGKGFSSQASYLAMKEVFFTPTKPIF